MAPHVWTLATAVADWRPQSGVRSLASIVLAVVFAADCYGIGKIRLGTTADGLEFHGAMDMSVKGILW